MWENDEEKGMKRALLTALILCAYGAVSAGPSIPWRVPEYSLVARTMPVREAFETFAVAEGVPVIVSESVKGSLSGNFVKVPAIKFLDRVATIHNLTWYYDGATIWVYAAGETLTSLIDLRYMKASEVLQLMRELGVEDSRYPLKEASNGELVMVSGPPRYVTLVVEMIGKADRLREQRTFTEIETRLFPLIHTWADDVSFRQSGSGLEGSSTIKGVASLLQEIMDDNVSGRVQDGTNAVETAANGRIRPVIRAENRLNAVLVRDATSRMPMYEDIIRKLDRPQKLVEIGVTILEMSKDDALDWQLSLGISGKHDSRSASHEAGAGMNIDNLMSPESLVGLGISAAYSYIGKNVDVNVSLSALKSKGKARSISRTSLLTMNNMMAEISDTESFSTRLVGEKVASVKETSAGTRLSVKPRILEPPASATNEARQIWLALELQDGGLDRLSTVDSLPTKRTTTLETQAALPEDDSLLLAGYFQDVMEDNGWGIPILRDIPVIGWLFGGASKVKTTVQRMFILTPHIVDLDYYRATTQNVASVQMLRQRDVNTEMELQDAADRDDYHRKEREAELEESRTIREETEKEKFRRNEKERDLRADQREDAQEKDREDWERDFERRVEEWKAREGK